MRHHQQSHRIQLPHRRQLELQNDPESPDHHQLMREIFLPNPPQTIHHRNHVLLPTKNLTIIRKQRIVAGTAYATNM